LTDLNEQWADLSVDKGQIHLWGQSLEILEWTVYRPVSGHRTGPGDSGQPSMDKPLTDPDLNGQWTDS